jgi:hypothetical protein
VGCPWADVKYTYLLSAHIPADENYCNFHRPTLTDENNFSSIGLFEKPTEINLADENI